MQIAEEQEISKIIIYFGVSLLFSVAFKFMHEYLINQLILKGGGKKPLNLHNNEKKNIAVTISPCVWRDGIVFLDLSLLWCKFFSVSQILFCTSRDLIILIPILTTFSQTSFKFDNMDHMFLSFRPLKQGFGLSVYF